MSQLGGHSPGYCLSAANIPRVPGRGAAELELGTKVMRRFAKISQSRRRPLLGRAFSWLKVPISTFKTLLRHYAKWALTSR